MAGLHQSGVYKTVRQNTSTIVYATRHELRDVCTLSSSERMLFCSNNFAVGLTFAEAGLVLGKMFIMELLCHSSEWYAYIERSSTT